MKQIVLLFICIVFSFTAFAQEKKDNVVKKERRIHFKIYYSPDYCYRKTHSEFVGVDVIRSQSSEILAYRSNQEIPSYGYDIGILTEIKLTQKLFFITGLSYEKMGYQTKQIDTVYSLFMNGGPYQYGEIINDMSVKYKFTFISLPVMLSYQIKFKKFKLYSSVGAAIDYLFKYQRVISFSTYHWFPPADDSNDIKGIKYNLSCMFNFGLGYQINKKITLVMEPHFKYVSMIGYNNAKYNSNISNPQMYFNDYMYKGRITKSSLYSLGCTIGIKF